MINLVSSRNSACLREKADLSSIALLIIGERFVFIFPVQTSLHSLICSTSCFRFLIM